jgi:hypothetical protein
VADLEDRPPLEVADILRAHGSAYRAAHRVSPEQAAVMRHLVACRTAALGGHVDACEACGLVRISYNSCRDRHCPKCQAARQMQWVEMRLARLLPVPYFHVVFTLPEQLQPLALKNQRLIYQLLFQAASQTLLQLAGDPRRLGAQIGITAVLHTWGQNLLFHPHLHCVVTGGGLAPDGRWVATRSRYFLPVRVLGSLFRGKFLAALQEAYQQGRLTLHGSVGQLACPRQFQQLLGQLYRQRWIVYAKPPFGGPAAVYRYLGRYTHRVAISNRRLLALEGNRVRFRYKDYADRGQQKEMTLTAEEFIRRFLLHVLPSRFVRIRHYGLLAGRNVATRLERCRQLLAPQQQAVEDPQPAVDQACAASDNAIGAACPHCGGALVRYPLSQLVFSTFWREVAIYDSS